MHHQPTTNTPRYQHRPLGRVFAAVAVSLLASLFTSAPASAARVTGINLISYWPIDEGVGLTIFDAIEPRANMAIYPNSGSYTWWPTEGAISLSNLPDGNSDANISSTGGSQGKLFNNITSANAFTAEVWFSPDTLTTPSGYAIIFSYGCHNNASVQGCTTGSGRYEGNFFIAQRNADVIAGFSNSNHPGVDTDGDGNLEIVTDAQLQLANVLRMNIPTHMVITWNGGNNGQKRIELRRTDMSAAELNAPPQTTNSEGQFAGLDYDLSTWKTNFIGIADPQNLFFSTKLQQFTGKVYLAAVYNRALAYNDPNDEIRQNYDAGPYPPCVDQDGDQYGNPANAECARLYGAGHDQLDCNDLDNKSFPGNPEICDEKDNDCAGDIVGTAINEGIDNGCDDDDDNYCDAGMAKDPTQSVDTCPNTATTAAFGDDCDDRPNGDNNNPGDADDGRNIYPTATEICNNVWNNCDLGTVDQGCDDDDDNYCDGDYNKAGGVIVTTCSATPAAATMGDDCNDTAATGGNVNPGQTEICDGKNNDCDAQTDEGLAGLACPVAGKQGECAIGSSTCTAGVPGCTQTIFPVAEVCNGKDDNCAGGVDDGFGTNTCGMGACLRTVPSCVAGIPQVCTPGPERAEDCTNLGSDDDCNNTIDDNLGAELCDGRDNDCNVATVDGSADADIRNRASCTPCLCGTCVWQCTNNNGKQCVSITGASREQCNGKDDNCVNGIDEGCEVYDSRQKWAREPRDPTKANLIFCPLAKPQ